MLLRFDPITLFTIVVASAAPAVLGASAPDPPSHPTPADAPVSAVGETTLTGPAGTLESARQALATASALEYSAVVTATGPESIGIATMPEVRVIAGPVLPASNTPRSVTRPLRVVGTVVLHGRTMPLAAATDGRELTALQPDRSAVWRGPVGEETAARLPFHRALLPGLGMEPLAAIDGEQLRGGGTTMVGDRVCDVVDLVSRHATGAAAESGRATEVEVVRRIAIDAETRIPRRFGRRITPLDGTDRGAHSELVLEVQGSITIDGAVPPAWTIDVPPGWEPAAPEAPRQRFALPIGAVAPNWTLRDGSGREHTLHSFRGRVVVLDFWATWCRPCLMSMPSQQALQERSQDHPVTVIGVSVFERRGNPAAFMAQQGFTYLGLVDGDRIARPYGCLLYTSDAADDEYNV